MKKHRYAYGWITLGFFAFSFVGHWLFGWMAFVNEHGSTDGYLVEMLRDTFENWQSEFLQLLWQVGGLAVFYYWKSPASKEGDERMELKIDALMRDRGLHETVLQIDKQYMRE